MGMIPVRPREEVATLIFKKNRSVLFIDMPAEPFGEKPEAGPGTKDKDEQ
jgi:hypothetical protein